VFDSTSDVRVELCEGPSSSGNEDVVAMKVLVGKKGCLLVTTLLNSFSGCLARFVVRPGKFESGKLFVDPKVFAALWAFWRRN